MLKKNPQFSNPGSLFVLLFFSVEVSMTWFLVLTPQMFDWPQKTQGLLNVCVLQTNKRHQAAPNEPTDDVIGG